MAGFGFLPLSRKIL